ncbi:hypothetical protein H4S02_013273, partial [Coemansia sp. RSA 2611]
AKHLPIMLSITDNYTIIKMKIDTLLKNLGKSPSTSPQIHISFADSGDKKEMSGNSTLMTSGFGENDASKPKSLNVFVDLPPPPEPDVPECACIIQ